MDMVGRTQAIGGCQAVVSVGFAVSRVSRIVHPKTPKMTSYWNYRLFYNFIVYVKYMKKDMRILFLTSKSFENDCFIWFLLFLCKHLDKLFYGNVIWS